MGDLNMYSKYQPLFVCNDKGGDLKWQTTLTKPWERYFLCLSISDKSTDCSWLSLQYLKIKAYQRHSIISWSYGLSSSKRGRLKVPPHLWMFWWLTTGAERDKRWLEHSIVFKYRAIKIKSELQLLKTFQDLYLSCQVKCKACNLNLSLSSCLT